MVPVFLAAALAAAPPLDPALLAPGPQQLARAQARVAELGERARVIGFSVARLHTRWAELSIQGRLGDPCTDPATRSLAARAMVFGRAYRDALQSARAESSRLERILAEPTVAPLLDAPARRAAERALGQVRDEVRTELEAASWHHRYVGPKIRACPPPLARAEGIESALVRPAKEASPAVAVVGIGGGNVCPSGQPANGRVLVIRDGRACYSEGSCTCAPASVLPGAVLGP